MRTTKIFTCALAIAALYCTDTAHGQTLTMVRDINPGAASSNIREPMVYNGRLLYFAETAQYGSEYYANHFCVSCAMNSVNPQSLVSSPRSLKIFAAKPLFISAEGTAAGDRVWCENNSAIQSERGIQHVTVLPYWFQETITIREMTPIGPRLWMSADVGRGIGVEPYFTTSLGSISPLSTQPGLTPSGVLLKDINPNGSSEPRNFTEFSGKVIFTATDGSKGTELWITDGTSTGTLQIKDINPGNGGVVFSKFVPYAGKLFFTARINGATELWCTDATTAGTVRVKDINPAGNDQVDDLFLWRDNLYFSATDGAKGVELWRSNGTAAGTVLLKDINPSGDSNPSQFSGYSTPIALGGKSYLAFAANNGSLGMEMWRTDGTTSGTVLLKDINPGPDGSSPREMIALAGYYYYSAIPGTNGRELMQFLPLNNNHTKLAPSIAPKVNPLGVSNVWPWFLFNNELYFYANFDSNGGELWKLTPRP